MNDISPETIAIFRRVAGQNTETFVERDLECLNYNSKVLVCERNLRSWSIKVHTLELNRPKSILARILKWLQFDYYREFQISRFFAKHEVKYALIHFLDYAVEVSPLLDKLGIPYIAIAHGYDASSKLRDPKYRSKLKNLQSAKAIIVVSEALKSNLADYGFEHPNTIVRPSSILIETFIPGCFRSRNTLLAVGRFVEKKSPFFLITMMWQLRRIRPDIRMFFVGDGPLFDATVELTKTLDITRNIFFLGAQCNSLVIDLTKACGALVQHSVTTDSGDMEGFPAIMQEALSQGLPVVATKHSGIPEHIVDGVTGFCSQEYQLENFVENVLKILDLTETEYNIMSLRCAQYAKENFCYSKRSKLIDNAFS